MRLCGPSRIVGARGLRDARGVKEFGKSRGKLAGVVAWLLLVTIQLAAQTTNYVAPTGNDANAGTLLAPWRTIQHAANVAAPGTTVLV